jgi:hypothetical protein
MKISAAVNEIIKSRGEGYPCKHFKLKEAPNFWSMINPTKNISALQKGQVNIRFSPQRHKVNRTDITRTIYFVRESKWVEKKNNAILYHCNICQTYIDAKRN